MSKIDLICQRNKCAAVFNLSLNIRFYGSFINLCDLSRCEIQMEDRRQPACSRAKFYNIE